MTPDDIINGILDREGEQGFAVAGDKGGRTAWGISERAHPAAWRNGPPTREEAFHIYMLWYVKPFEWVENIRLQNQLIDFAVTSGQRRAVYWLQRVMGITADGVIGPRTKQAVNDYESLILNNALVAARLKFIDEMTDEEKSQKKFEEGWENRALGFLILS